MIIRDYFDDRDAPAVGRLISETFATYNLANVSPDMRDRLLGPFFHADSDEPVHRREIVGAIRSEMVFIAEDRGEIVGVLRGRRTRLGSLFVRGDRHRQGIGRALVERFESQVRVEGGCVVKVAAAPSAVPFYLKVGYKRCTGMRSLKLLGGADYPYQPMKKDLA
jgi:GNAT superfamily N-acetyltransferase